MKLKFSLFPVPTYCNALLTLKARKNAKIHPTYMKLKFPLFPVLPYCHALLDGKLKTCHNTSNANEAEVSPALCAHMPTNNPLHKVTFSLDTLNSDIPI